MAPEVVKQTAYTSKADIWSLGCLIVEMLTGEHPWAKLTQMQAIFKVCLWLHPMPKPPSPDESNFFSPSRLARLHDRRSPLIFPPMQKTF